MKLTAACAFGLEAIVKRELIALGYEAKIGQPGRIDFEGDWEAVCRANMWLRTADRVLIEVQKFDAPDFDALFDTVKEFDWSQFTPKDAAFPVTGRSRLSQLTSVPAVQRTVKRALVESLMKYHGVSVLPETGQTFKLDVAMLNDVATITIDTTGASLHKRGYRKLVAEAPIKETLAAAMVNLSVWKAGRPLIDPFCGSGTIPIEAALAGLNIAPGISRQFACSDWDAIDKTLWRNASAEANDLRKRDVQLQIIATDRDKEVLSLARYHSELAGVDDQIHFQEKSFDQLRSKREYGCIITNPPYGERLEQQKRLIGLYQSIPAVMQRLPTWSLFLITNMPRFQNLIERQATRRRKLFNGRLECTYYQFLGPRPPRTDERSESTTHESGEKTPLETNESVSNPTDSPDEITQNYTVSVETAPSEVAFQESELRKTKPRDPENPKAEAPTSAALTAASSVTQSQETQSQETEPQKTEPRELQPENSVPKQAAPQEPELLEKPKAKPEQVAPLFGGLTEKDHEQAQLFHNRLKKLARHLRRWPTKRGITCFRLYERDIPEIPLVVDRYEDSLHITEYDRPHVRDLARHAAWLELMVKTASSTLDIPITRVHMKRKQKSRDTRQYEKVASKSKLTTVNEGGLKFLVNLTDYVDTGLFLDHRATREMVRKDADKKDVLNLFAYTGSFSVYAASGGAATTTTVDLSKNYLEWAKKNFEANGLANSNHSFVAQDSLEFLDTVIDDPRRRFDLAIVDPPTFSNSKKTEEDWEVQTRHVELLTLVHQVMRLGGIVYFSTNFRRFKFDEDAMKKKYEIREISKRTVPEDFRNKRIHRCWRLVKNTID